MSIGIALGFYEDRPRLAGYEFPDKSLGLLIGHIYSVLDTPGSAGIKNNFHTIFKPQALPEKGAPAMVMGVKRMTALLFSQLTAQRDFGREIAFPRETGHQVFADQ